MNDYTNLLSLLVTPGEPPAEVEPQYYRALSGDLTSLSDHELRHHFAQHGRQDGRSASPADHRRGLVAIIPKTASVLEIGPMTAPTLRGPNVRYFDVLDRAALMVRATEHHYPIIDPPVIDYVSPDGDLMVIPDKFEYVFSAHCIEHAPDIVGHLEGVARLLDRKGRYLLVVPDKRYCFDHFFACSTFEQVVQAHAERRRVHSRETVLANYTESTHNNPAAHWRGEHADDRADQMAWRRSEAIRVLDQAQGGYVDVHAWFFTPDTFRHIMGQASSSGLIPFEVERVYSTLYGSNEFCAVLQRKP